MIIIIVGWFLVAINNPPVAFRCPIVLRRPVALRERHRRLVFVNLGSPQPPPQERLAESLSPEKGLILT